jgi:uncharacterized protein (DUF1697 family)
MANKNNRFVALLRGINVGGHNIIAQDDLRRCFESIGLSSVLTYIQSGNVLFRSNAKSIKNLTGKIEAALSSEFSYEARAVVLSHEQFASDLQAIPENWGVDETRKHNALFMLGELQPAQILAQLPAPKEKYEKVGTGKCTIFWSASKKDLGKTTMMKLASMPVYKQMTIRNHKTTFKLLTLFEEI